MRKALIFAYALCMALLFALLTHLDFLRAACFSATTKYVAIPLPFGAFIVLSIYFWWDAVLISCFALLILNLIIFVWSAVKDERNNR